jgi:hypothetical protein
MSEGKAFAKSKYLSSKTKDKNQYRKKGKQLPQGGTEKKFKYRKELPTNDYRYEEEETNENENDRLDLRQILKEAGL